MLQHDIVRYITNWKMVIDQNGIVLTTDIKLQVLLTGDVSGLLQLHNYDQRLYLYIMGINYTVHLYYHAMVFIILFMVGIRFHTVQKTR